MVIYMKICTHQISPYTIVQGITLWQDEAPPEAASSTPLHLIIMLYVGAKTNNYIEYLDIHLLMYLFICKRIFDYLGCN